MLPKKQRIKTKDFPQKKPLSRGAFSWGTASLFSSPSFSVAVVVSKKVFKTAVLRNKARRRVYMATQKTKLTPNVSLVLYPNKNFFDTSFELIKRDITSFLHSAS